MPKLPSHAAFIPTALLLASLLGAAGPQPPLEFAHGVASGDVTSTSAVIWARASGEVPLKLEVSRDPALDGPDVFRSIRRVSPATDLTVRVRVEGLEPDVVHYYRWRRGNRSSEIGTFRTAPAPNVPASVRFAWSGDSDGTLVDGLPFYNEFEVLDRVREEGPAFFVYLGDTIYSDSGLRPSGPATTVDEYREAYKVNRSYPALRSLLSAVPMVAIWDDHEVRNDYDGQTVDPARYANGRQAFLEYMPLGTGALPSDPTCAGDPLFRVLHWGADVDVIVLDERSCRSGDVSEICQSDLGPTLPADRRASFGLAPDPPAGCLEAIFDPGRTLLGPVQKERFKQALLASTAKFKFVINELPIQQYWALPYDRWEGYGAERNEILNFIREHGIENVIFLSTDNHGNFANEVFVDRFTDPAPIAFDVVTGPIATNTLEKSILDFAGPPGLIAFNLLFVLAGVDCRDLDAFSYGLVDVDAASGTTTITLKDDTGAVLHDTLTPAVPCVFSFGP